MLRCLSRTDIIVWWFMSLFIRVLSKDLETSQVFVLNVCTVPSTAAFWICLKVIRLSPSVFKRCYPFVWGLILGLQPPLARLNSQSSSTSILRFWYLVNFSYSFCSIRLSLGIATPMSHTCLIIINIYCRSYLRMLTIYSLLLACLFLYSLFVAQTCILASS